MNTRILAYKDTALKLAPLAHCNSFLSCQGSGYQTPEEDDRDNRMNTPSTASVTSCSSNNGSEEDLSKIYINTQYADIKSISDYGDNINNKTTKQYINLPEIEIESYSQVFFYLKIKGINKTNNFIFVLNNKKLSP